MHVFKNAQEQPQEQASVNATRMAQAPPATGYQSPPILYLHRLFGNQPALRLQPANADERQAAASLSATTNPRFAPDLDRIPMYSTTPVSLQAKRTVNTSRDSYERDAVFSSGQYLSQANRSAHELAPLSEKRIARKFLSNQDFSIHGRTPPPGDAIHDPLLDRYSRETGLPRNTVTQHDRGYEAWLLGKPIATPPINIALDMKVPAIPPPDYSQDETQLGAWERANFLFTAQTLFVCDHVINNGIESSFVTDIGLRMTQPTFQYFIARQLYENMNDRGKPAGERVTWRRLHDRIRQHAQEHFTRYRQVTDTMRQMISQRFAALPTRNSPIRIPQQELETYTRNLLLYLVARLRFELWQTTCDWERTDYPNLPRGIPNVQGRFVPACDPRPSVPPEPIMPVVVTPATSPPATSRRRP